MPGPVDPDDNRPKPAPREEIPGEERSVNLEVDRPWILKENEILSSRLKGARFQIRVLERGGRCPTAEFLDDVRRGGSELGILLAQVEALCRAERKFHERYAVAGMGGVGIFEVKKKTHHFRLFYFYGEDNGLDPAFVVFTHGFNKVKSSKDEQDKQFLKAARIRDEFLGTR